MSAPELPFDDVDVDDDAVVEDEVVFVAEDVFGEADD